VQPGYLAESFRTYSAVLEILENNDYYLNQNPKCEPQLGKRGLYRTMGGYVESEGAELAMFWVLNLSDGQHSLLDIAERSKLAFPVVRAAAETLEAAGLLALLDAPGQGGT
jgi:aminopeptidase-like protein